MGPPVVIPDLVARHWLEVNYLWATHFYPGGLPGVGETGADLRHHNGRTYLVSYPGLFNAVQRAFHMVRPVEGGYRAWASVEENVRSLVDCLRPPLVEALQAREGPGESLQECPRFFHYRSGTPSPGLFAAALALAARMGAGEATSLASEEKRLVELLHPLKEYDFPKIEALFEEIRKFHKGAPTVHRGFLYLSQPAASGGICLHTHPGSDDPLDALLSASDLTILAAQSGALSGVVHVGGGETQGEVYVFHVPRKHFFDEVDELVQAKGDQILEALARAAQKAKGTCAALQVLQSEVHPLKAEVLTRGMADLMDDEILGFSFKYASVRDGNREIRASPVVSRTEYEKHKAAVDALGLTGEDLPLEQLLFEKGDKAYAVKSVFQP